MNSRLSAASAEFCPGFGAGSNGNDSQAEAEARQSAENRLRTAITRKAERLATTKHVINLGLVPSQGPLEEGGFPMTMATLFCLNDEMLPVAMEKTAVVQSINQVNSEVVMLDRDEKRRRAMVEQAIKEKKIKESKEAEKADRARYESKRGQLMLSLGSLQQKNRLCQEAIDETLEKMKELEQIVDDKLKKAFRRQSILHHPDKVGDNALTRQKYATIQLAYEVMTCPSCRREYVEYCDDAKWMASVGLQHHSPEGAMSFQQNAISLGQPDGCSRLDAQEINAKGSVRIDWLCKGAVRCEVTHYNVEVEYPDNALLGGECQVHKVRSPFGRQTSLTLHNLERGVYFVRVNAQNSMGPGQWSQKVMFDVDRGEKQAEENLKRAEKQAKERMFRRIAMMESARDGLKASMSTLNSRSVFAVENLEGALSFAKKTLEEPSKDDLELLERGEAALDALKKRAEMKESLKDWKEILKPYPSPEVLNDISADDITREVANMIYQYIKGAVHSARQNKLPADLDDLDPVIAACRAAERRSDILSHSWMSDISDEREGLEQRVASESKRRKAEEAKRKKEMERETERLAVEAAQYAKRQEEALKKKEQERIRKEMQEKIRAEKERREQEMEYQRRQADAVERAERAQRESIEALRREEERYRHTVENQAALSAAASRTSTQRHGDAPAAASRTSGVTSARGKSARHKKSLDSAQTENEEDDEVMTLLVAQQHIEAARRNAEYMAELKEQDGAHTQSVTMSPAEMAQFKGSKHSQVVKRFPRVSFELQLGAKFDRKFILKGPRAEVEAAAILCRFFAEGRCPDIKKWCTCGRCTTPHGCIGNPEEAQEEWPSTIDHGPSVEVQVPAAASVPGSGLCSGCREQRSEFVFVNPCRHVICKQCSELLAMNAMLLGDVMICSQCSTAAISFDEGAPAPSPPAQNADPMVGKLLVLGVPEEMAKTSLFLFSRDFDKALEWLVSEGHVTRPAEPPQNQSLGAAAASGRGTGRGAGRGGKVKVPAQKGMKAAGQEVAPSVTEGSKPAKGKMGGSVPCSKDAQFSMFGTHDPSNQGEEPKRGGGRGRNRSKDSAASELGILPTPSLAKGAQAAAAVIGANSAPVGKGVGRGRPSRAAGKGAGQ